MAESTRRCHAFIRALARVATAAAILVGPSQARAQGPGLPVYMQIVAHEDDDFLFMNPELGNQISGGYGSVTVYLTAGQSVGTDVHATPTLTRQQFARARQRGELAANAQMVGVANQWTRSIETPDGSHSVEVYTLVGAPRIKLVFMGLPDGGDDIVPNNNAVGNMWDAPGFVTNTIVPECSITEDCFWSPLPVQYYNRAAVIAVLQVLVSNHQPTFVRTLDPQPFQGGFLAYDNPDHIATARFADAVLAGYHGPFGTRRYTVSHYKGYSFLEYPYNLGDSDYTEKQATAYTYRPYDPNYVYFTADYEGYYHVLWDRYPASTTWLERAGDGRLVAVAVEDRQVLSWQESAPGGAWIGPIRLPGTTPLSPHLTLLRRPDGRLQIFALRLPLERENWFNDQTVPPQEIVTAVQIDSPGAIRFGPWSVVGSPNEGCTSLCQFAGVQTAAIDGAGRTFVFAKNSDGRVAYTQSTGGPWSSWLAFVSPDVVDGIAAITRDDGRVEAFATARSGQILHFLQQAVGTGAVGYDSSFATFGNAASAPTVTKNADGRPEIFYREPSTGRVLTVYQTGGGSWAGPVVLYGDAGLGPVAAIRRGATGHIMLFERNVWSGISATWQQAPNDVFYLQWQILGGYLNEYPSAASDVSGRAVLSVKGGDGRLYFQREAGAIGSFGGWNVMECLTGDLDADGLCDAADNCPGVANPEQEDVDSNGVGNVCECGDVDLTNAVDGVDVSRLRAQLAQLPPGLSAAGLARCSVIGTAVDCDVRDVAILRRFLALPTLAPGISRICAAANP